MIFFKVTFNISEFDKFDKNFKESKFFRSIINQFFVNLTQFFSFVFVIYKEIDPNKKSYPVISTLLELQNEQLGREYLKKVK